MTEYRLTVSDGSFDAENANDSKRVLKSLRTTNSHKLVFPHLNANSIRNYFEMLWNHIKDNQDVLMVLETEIDDNIPNGIFKQTCLVHFMDQIKSKMVVELRYLSDKIYLQTSLKQKQNQLMY